MKSDVKVSELNVEQLIPAGLQHLVKGYTDYAKEVVTERAIPGIDGFKPSQRRILYTMMHFEKAKTNVKCADIAGSTMKLHPHGDAPIYQTLVRMVDESEVMNVPFLAGKGAFGKVYTTDAPAASRYTECRLAPISEELFGEMGGVEFVPNYNNKYQEPSLLPTSFPNILCNTTQGIAVGVASNIPSFNFHEVINATIKYIQTGVLDILAPDFTTGGYYVRDENALRALLDTGRARLKLRGKWHIDGKSIIIEEIPYYTTVTEIMSEVKNIVGVSDVRDESDKNGLRLSIECSNRKVLEEVLNQVLRQSSLQKTITTNIVVIIDNKPQVIGIRELLDRWIDFRSGVLNKTLAKDLEKVVASIENYEVLVALLSNEEHRKKLMDLLMESDSKAIEFLSKLFPHVKSFDYILNMSLKSISNVSAKVRHLDSLKMTKIQIESDLKDIPGVIVRHLSEANSKYSFRRRTEITNEDFVFEQASTKVVKLAPVATKVLINGKFIKKMRSNPITALISGTINCMSDDVISFIDTHGRLLRVNLDNLEFVSEYDRGVFLPSYLETADDFEVMAYEVISDKIVGYMYSDGFVSVVDYSEWHNSQRCTRVTTNGVSDMAKLIVGELNFSKPYVLMVTKDGRIGFAQLNFKQKHRSARTRLVGVKENDAITTIVGVTYPEMLSLVASPEKYMGKLASLGKGDRLNMEFLDRLLKA